MSARIANSRIAVLRLRRQLDIDGVAAYVAMVVVLMLATSAALAAH